MRQSFWRLFRRLAKPLNSRVGKVAPSQRRCMTYSEIKTVDSIVSTFQRLTDNLWHEGAAFAGCDGYPDRVTQYALLSQAIIESISTGILIIEKTKVIGLINSAGRRILRLGDREIAGLALKDVLEDHGELERSVDAVLRTGCCQSRREMNVKTDDGKRIRLGASLSPIKGSKGQVEAVILVFTQLDGDRLLSSQRRNDIEGWRQIDNG